MSPFLSAVLAGVLSTWLSPVHAAPCAGFLDVEDSSPFCANVAWVKNRGITLGCTSTTYCPDAPVSRNQMAAFLSRMSPMVAPAIVGVDGAVFGYYVAAALTPPQSYAVLNRDGVNYFLPIDIVVLPNDRVQFALPMHVIHYERADCDEGGRKWSATMTPTLSERAAFIVTESYDLSTGTSVERLYGSEGRNSGRFNALAYRTPLTFRCMNGPTAVDDPHELSYLGNVSLKGPLAIR